MAKLDKSKIVKDMLRDFKISSDAEADNRTRALYVLDFVRPGANQWDSMQKTARGSRASYSFNQLPKFGRQVINDMWQNMAQIKYIPKGDTNKDKAEVLEDKIREIQATGSAQTAYKLAIASQINIGWGYFAFCTEYDNDEDFNQNICIRQIPNTFQIYDDPTTREQDRSDRRFLIEVEDVPRTDFNADNGKSYTESDLTAIGDQFPSWATVGKDIVRIGHYWRVEYKSSKLYAHKETGVVTKEKPENEDDYNVRDVKTPKVMYYKCTATEMLEDHEWLGKYIPFCFVEGNKTIVDGKTYYTGLYEDMINPQILYNYATNTAIELAESAPIAPITGDWRAFVGFEEFYDNANTKNYSRLPFNAIDKDGQPIAPPQRLQNGSDLGSAVQLIQMAEQNFYGTSGIYPASLGQQSNEKSGKAIIARQKEGDVSTSNYPDAFGRALLYGGKIFQDLSRKVLDGARIIQVMAEDKKTRDVPINQQFIDKQTGKPMMHDLTVGDYEAVISTGASYSTKREEAREAQIQLFQAAPQAMLPALPNIIRNMDYPGADKDAEAVERGLPPELRAPEDMNEKLAGMPPEAQAQMQMMGKVLKEMQAQLQQTGQALQDAESQLQSKQAETQAKILESNNKAQSEALKAQNDAAKAENDRLQILVDNQKTLLEIRQLDFDTVKLKFEALQSLKQQEPQKKPELGESTNEQMDNGYKEAELQQQADGINMLAQMLDGIKNALDAQSMAVVQLTQTVSAPKTAVKGANGNWVVAPATMG